MDDEPDLGKSLNFLVLWHFQIPCGEGCGQVLPGTLEATVNACARAL